jgi:hypothetical protein
MVSIVDALFVVVNQMAGERAPRPLPLSSGFSEGMAYRILGLHSPSETGEAYLILSNDRDEIWFVSNRHFRTWDLRQDTNALRLPLTDAGVVPGGTHQVAH